jgi:pilus assembly protein CpaC
VGFSHTVEVPHLRRAAIANAKIARVRASGGNRLLIVGLRPGLTVLRAWDAAEREFRFAVEVLSPALDPSLQTSENRDVIQVALEFLELDRTAGRNLGIHWPDAFQVDGGLQMQGAASMTGLNYSLGVQSSSGFLQLLVRNGWAKVLAHPDLYVRLGEEADFRSGGEFPVPSTQETYGRYQRYVEWKSYGLVVKVRPESGDRLHIRSDIHVEVSEPNPGGGIDGIPALNRRNLDTKMNSEDGETVILSGLVKQGTTHDEDGIPILSSIPLLGGLFSRRSESSEETEILIAVTFSFSTRARERGGIDDFRRRFDERGAAR